MEQILLTGANGLLGSQIAKRLILKGYSVRAIKREKSNLCLLGEDVDKIEWFEGDVRDVVSLEAAMEGVSTVIHCAAMISFVPEDAAMMMQVNAEGTANVVDSALHCGVKKIKNFLIRMGLMVFPMDVFHHPFVRLMISDLCSKAFVWV